MSLPDPGTWTTRPSSVVVTVSVAQGALRGKKTKTQSGGPMYSFQGIPYAKPPVGPLRFKAPEPADSWTGMRDALQEGSKCFHYDILTKTFVGSEDCLFINVYTHKLPADRSEPLRPVMVFIHGGGFHIGSGNTDFYGPDYLVDQGVVVVTFNYRLGPLGFLNLENGDVSGNMGMKDQVLALKWVKQTIASFGGNPNNVTIFGESAGGACVHLHVLSPMSKGLFHRAICQSGTALNSWVIARNPRERAFRLGQAMKCKTKDDKELMEFLQNADPKDLCEAMEACKTKEEKKRLILFTFTPSVEPEVKGQEAFLPKHPEVLLKEGKFNRVPMMVGVTSKEGMVILMNTIEDPSLLDTLDSDMDRLVPEDLLPAKRDLVFSRRLSDKVKQFYFGSQSIDEKTIDNLVNLVSDKEFVLGTMKTLKMHVTTASNAPVYFYEFDFDGGLNMCKNVLLKGMFGLKGASHGDDIGYLFLQDFVNLQFPPDSPEMLTVRRMTKMWTNFARTGNPTPALDEDISVVWKPFTLANPCHLKINSELVLAGEYEKERVDFWNQLQAANNFKK